jgi:hypothetical protein
MDWDDPKTLAAGQDDNIFIYSMKAIQFYVSKLSEYFIFEKPLSEAKYSIEADGKIGRKVSIMYRDGDPKSVALSISSLLFTSRAECVVTNFC